MRLNRILESIGLNEKEARVYLVLLELKEAVPSTISRKSNIKRPTTYLVLDHLQDRGLVSHTLKGKIKHYRALHPSLLLEDQYNRYLALKKSLPELISLHDQYSIIPQMTVHQGREGLMNIMEDTLTAETGLLCWADISLAVNSCLNDYYPIYISKKVKRNIELKGVFVYDKTALRFKKRGREEMRDIRLVPKEKFPFKNEINIYNDKVAIISHADDVGVIIQNSNIADTQRAIFQLGFEYAKMIEPSLLTKADLDYLNNK